MSSSDQLNLSMILLSRQLTKMDEIELNCMVIDCL